MVTVKAAALNRAFKNVKENDVVSLTAKRDEDLIVVSFYRTFTE